MRGNPSKMKMKIRCQWLTVLILLSALPVKGVAQSPAPTEVALAIPEQTAPEERISPADLYARAFLANHMADELAGEGKLEDAADRYAHARECFESLQAEYPEWRTDMVEFRLQWNNTALVETKAKLTALATPVAPLAPEEIPRALPANLPAAPVETLPAPAGVEMVSAPNREQQETAIPKAIPVPLRPAGFKGKKLTILILADSMAIGGFGEKLDALFRADPGVAAVHTFIACGTNPLSWMKRPPYANAATRCGYWSIQSVPGENSPMEVKDVYGEPSGNRPSSHTVPKLEDLVARYQPDVVIMQNGNNFFSSFSDGKSIVEGTHGTMVRTHVAPLIDWLSKNGTSIRKFYWVSPPEAGNVTPEIQQYVFDRIASEVKGIGTMIDSREFTSFPYQAQGADKEHFWGNECAQWGADTFAAIAADLSSASLWKEPTLTERGGYRTTENVPVVETATPGPFSARLKLIGRTPIPPPAAFAPYGEMLVGFLYKVSSVSKGRYKEKEVLVFHPAYIHHVREDLSGFREGKSYRLDLIPFTADSVWTTVGQDDAVGDPLMTPYMLSTDVGRHPNLATSSNCCD